MSNSSILPDDHAQFTSKDYWDKFFIQRGQFAFEWYGDFREVYPSLSRFLSKNDRILIIGCGNSNFSSDLYDKGYHQITNLDFSELVIQEMQTKNSSRHEMKWVVGDMTALELIFSPASFDVVVDKGALDALMSIDSLDLRSKALQMFDEISAVLTSNGKYFLISLGEDYILQTVSSYFMRSSVDGDVSNDDEHSWEVRISQIITSKPSPFVPLLFTLAKSVSPTDRKAIVSMSAVNAKRRALVGKQSSTESSCIAFGEIPEFIKSFQEFNQLSFRVRKLEVGRFETVPLWSSENIEVPRFTLYIVDASEQATLSCAVFFIPFGREADYQFTTQDGLLDIAFQAACKRLIVVACNRPHVFGEMPQLQDELSPIIMELKLCDMPPSEKIPFMAVAHDKSWEEIEQGKSNISGIYVVEERVDEDEDGAVYRRLIFLQNQQFVQTEIRLVPAKRPNSAKKKGKGKKTNKIHEPSSSSGEKPSLVFDYKYLDEHHKGIIACLALNSKLVLSASQRCSEGKAVSLLIGLGGGALVMALQKYLPSLQLTACDIDESVLDIARRHFAFESTSNTSISIQDGICLLHDLWRHSRTDDALLKDFIIIDVDSKDPSLGLSAPPREFVTYENLERMYDILKPGGLLIFNVVARSKSKYAEFVARVKTIFRVQMPVMITSASPDGTKGRVLEMKPADENINICLICLKGGLSVEVPASTTSKHAKKLAGPAKEDALWSKSLERWLEVS